VSIGFLKETGLDWREAIVDLGVSKHIVDFFAQRTKKNAPDGPRINDLESARPLVSPQPHAKRIVANVRGAGRNRNGK
jgi:hypothetical protein